MIRVALTLDNNYKVVSALGADTPYQILTMNHVNLNTRKVFINGKKVDEEKIKYPLSVFQPQGGTLFLTVRI